MPVFGPDSPPGAKFAQLNQGWLTNDHCMYIALDRGVRVSAYDFLNGRLRFAHLDSGMSTRESPLTVPAVGDVLDPVPNTSSARRVGTDREAVLYVVAPERINFDQPSDLRVLVADLDLSGYTEQLRISALGEAQLQMGTRVDLPGGYVLITCKRLQVGWRTSQYDADGGDLVRWLVHPSGGITKEVLLDCESLGFERCANRPHTILYENAGTTYVLTTWDEANLGDGAGGRVAKGTLLGCRMRVDTWP